MNSTISTTALEALERIDTCSVANAIETFHVRLRNEGFTDSSIRCRFERLPPVVGYAVTLKIRSAAPHLTGKPYFDRNDWWERMAEVPGPRIIVMEDIDPVPGIGAFIGEVHSHIFRALGCVAAVTTGSVRDLDAIDPMGFQLFSKNVTVSHAYVHVVEFGTPVMIGGLAVRPGDLLHGDRHGLIQVPFTIAERLPETVARIRREEDRLIQYCDSDGFSTGGLRHLLSGTDGV